jgi:hypothetical protein
MPLDEKDLERGTELFLQHLEEIIDSEPEVGDIHGAFEFYSAKRFSLGTRRAITAWGAKAIWELTSIHNTSTATGSVNAKYQKRIG